MISKLVLLIAMEAEAELVLNNLNAVKVSEDVSSPLKWHLYEAMVKSDIPNVFIVWFSLYISDGRLFMGKECRLDGRGVF